MESHVYAKQIAVLEHKLLKQIELLNFTCSSLFYHFLRCKCFINNGVF